MKVSTNVKNDNYLILKDGDQIIILADKNIKSAITIKCEKDKLIIISNKKEY